MYFCVLAFNTYILVSHTLFPQGGTYSLGIISAPLERVWSTPYTSFVLKNQLILLVVDWY